MKKLLIGAVLTLASAMASAELMNISSGAYQTDSQDALACTIVDDGTILISGRVMLFVFAEGEGDGNPNLRVWSLDREYVTLNNNWGDGFDVTINGQTTHINLRDIDPNGGLVYPSILRAPRRASDAAAFVLANRGEKICAQSLDTSGTGKQQRVAISLTDMNAIAYKSLQKSAAADNTALDARGVHMERVLSNVQKQLGD